MVGDAINFDAPLVTIARKMHVLELFHGPSLAFKDFGARFMARLRAWLTRKEERDLMILVATSGDTGGAVASAFHGVPGTKVVLLYPSGKVSDLQEKHLGLDGTDLRNNENLARLRENLGSSHRNLVHRDFQSQNIILHGERAWLIDFQGLRLGRQEYDLASLLYDPYLDHPEEEQAKLLDLWEDISEERPVPELLRDCAIQRLMQALGAYANILHEQQIDWYAQHIPTAARLLLSQVGNTPLEAPLRPVLETSIEK